MSEPELISESKEKCFVCGAEEMEVRNYVHDAGLAGKLLISVWQCGGCGYRSVDVKPWEGKLPVTLEFKVEDPDDLNVLVYRSALGTLSIPELGLEITPGSSSHGNITTVEGILEEVLEIFPEEQVEAIREAKEGKVKFTLLIRDPSGSSFIKSDRVKAISQA
ncbi:ZPR1 zinc finger domain-containing protein [Sulfodiicoccus acidiphilus]|nr:ZPR1 zinc finger domain-containing protein [Sulfodiicoccus acidiphilus]